MTQEMTKCDVTISMENGFSLSQSSLLKSFILEARSNDLLLFLMDSNRGEYQDMILSELILLSSL